MTEVEDQASQAEGRSQETRSFVRQVRAATRRKYMLGVRGFGQFWVREIGVKKLLV